MRAPLKKQSKRYARIANRQSALIKTVDQDNFKNLFARLLCFNYEVNKKALHEILVNKFSLEELRTLYFKLNVDFDELPGLAKSDKARELIDYMIRVDRLDELIALIWQEREKTPVRWIFKGGGSQAPLQKSPPVQVGPPVHVRPPVHAQPPLQKHGPISDLFSLDRENKVIRAVEIKGRLSRRNKHGAKSGKRDADKIIRSSFKP